MTRIPVSSATSRTAVSSMCSPGSRLPFGKLHSSQRLRWITATSSPAGPRRHSTAPAARISATGSGIGDAALPDPDQVTLQIAQRRAALVQVMPGPYAIGAEPPGRGALVHRVADEAAQLSLLRGVGDADQELDPPVQVPVHEVGAAEPDLTVVIPGAERVYPRVLEEAAEDTADPDRLRQARHAGPQPADPAYQQVDRNPGT